MSVVLIGATSPFSARCEGREMDTSREARRWCVADVLDDVRRRGAGAVIVGVDESICTSRIRRSASDSVSLALLAKMAWADDTVVKRCCTAELSVEVMLSLSGRLTFELLRLRPPFTGERAG